MKISYNILVMVLFPIFGLSTNLYSLNFIPANHPYIQYYGRWDMRNPLHPKHSWPGVYIYIEFMGTGMGIRTDDNINYYNVYIDGKFQRIFHGDKSGTSDYTLARNLKDTQHTFRFSLRNISFGNPFSISGFLLDDKANFLKPPLKPRRKIEFIGDSFTVAEGNEAKEPEMPWDAKFPVTNIDKGFAPLIAQHYKAQYHTTCRSGIGMVCDWQGKTEFSMPNYFDHTLMESSVPKWDFKQWIPELVILCLGLNDSSGLKGKDGTITQENSLLFRTRYKDFLNTLRKVYPGVKILAIAAHPDWIRNNIRQIVDEEKTCGYKDIYYAQFDYFDGGYVANGHPTVETHQKIADQIIQSINSYHLFIK